MENANNCIDSALFEKILTYGAVNLQANKQEINDLNVFPVPDGDTGTNMYATLAGGIDNLKKNEMQTVGQKAEALAEGMLLNARGNSGVILSQLFYGIAQGLMGVKVATIPQFGEALRKGVQFAYKAVVKPVEGTILTVAREAAELVCLKIDKNTTLEKFFRDYLKELKVSLQRTPELLEILKESNVVDSGGAGLVCIAEGFYKAIVGDVSLDEVAITVDQPSKTQNGNNVLFDKDSKMDYGYCTEALVQLLDSKKGVESFVLNDFIEFLTSLGDSVVAVQTGTKVKVHVHTMTPSLVLAECQKYGEFISVKIENMTLQHNDVLGAAKHQKRVKTAIVAVSSGDGFTEIYREYGADYIVCGGQTDNPSAEEFIKGFDSVNAENIFVLPNNKNIVLAAKQAAELYTKSNVVVLPTKTPQQVYCALMVCTSRDDVETLRSDMEEAVSEVESYAITYAVRDAVVGGIEINKGDYMAFKEGALIIDEKDEFNCLQKMFDTVEDIDDKAIVTVFYGKTVDKDLKSKVHDFIENRCPDADLVEYDGGQDVYSFLISLE